MRAGKRLEDGLRRDRGAIEKLGVVFGLALTSWGVGMGKRVKDGKDGKDGTDGMDVMEWTGRDEAWNQR